MLPLPIQAEEIPNDNFEHLQNYNSDDDRPLRVRVADPGRARDRNRVLGVEELPPPQPPAEVTPPQVRPKIPMTLHAQKKQRARRAAEHATFGFKAPDFSPETPPRNVVSVQLQDQNELERIATPPKPTQIPGPSTGINHREDSPDRIRDQSYKNEMAHWHRTKMLRKKTRPPKSHDDFLPHTVRAPRRRGSSEDEFDYNV